MAGDQYSERYGSPTLKMAKRGHELKNMASSSQKGKETDPPKGLQKELVPEDIVIIAH